MTEYWTPPPMWTGEDAHILASGPSLTADVIESARGRNVIVINSTALSAPWAPVWFFCDPEVLFRKRRSTVARVASDGTDMVEFAKAFSGIVVTTSPRVKKELPRNVRLVKAERSRNFPAPGSQVILQGRSSGQTAIAIAVGLGARRIYLHGFDMRAVDGREHHHREYENCQRNPGVYESHFLPAFAGWNGAALRAGVAIVNATPGSALKEFPMMENTR